MEIEHPWKTKAIPRPRTNRGGPLLLKSFFYFFLLFMAGEFMEIEHHGEA